MRLPPSELIEPAPGSFQERRVRRMVEGRTETVPDPVTAEHPLEIHLRWRCESGERRIPLSVTLRTPGDDRELAAGFVYNEGVAERPEDLASVTPESDDRVVVDFTAGARPVLPESRAFAVNAACGACGKPGADALGMDRIPEVGHGDLRVARSAIDLMALRARDTQPVFELTGGCHASSLFGADGEPVAAREDVGRHNALDKLTGHLLLRRRLPAGPSILLLSGRTGFELVQKAARTGIPVVVAVGAPTTLAISVAEMAGITLAGFLKPGRLNLYCHPERITDS